MGQHPERNTASVQKEHGRERTRDCGDIMLIQLGGLQGISRESDFLPGI